MKKIRLQKKGSAFDVVITFVFVFTMVLISGICLFIYDSFNTEWQEADDVTQNSKDISAAHNARMEAVLDGAIILYFVILWIISIVSALFINSNPVYFIIFALLSIFSLVGVVSISLIMPELTDSSFGEYLALMPMSVFLLDQSIWFATMYIMTVAAALYFKIGGRE